MEPLTIGLSLLNLAVLGYDRLIKPKREKAAADPPQKGPQPMLFTPHAVDTFTRLDAAVRHFGDRARLGVLSDLEHRSVIPQAVPEQVRTIASAFRVVPRIEGQPSAAEVIRRAAGAGATVLGSLSLVGLMSGIDTTFAILVTDDAGARQLAPEKDQTGMPAAWALLQRPDPKPAEDARAPAKPHPATDGAPAPAATVEAPPPDIAPPDPPAQKIDDMPPYPVDTSRFQRIEPKPNGVAAPRPSLGEAVGTTTPET